jgi:hypothetical protein
VPPPRAPPPRRRHPPPTTTTTKFPTAGVFAGAVHYLPQPLPPLPSSNLRARALAPLAAHHHQGPVGGRTFASRRPPPQIQPSCGARAHRRCPLLPPPTRGRHPPWNCAFWSKARGRNSQQGARGPPPSPLPGESLFQARWRKQTLCPRARWPKKAQLGSRQPLPDCCLAGLPSRINVDLLRAPALEGQAARGLISSLRPISHPRSAPGDFCLQQDRPANNLLRPCAGFWGPGSARRRGLLPPPKLVLCGPDFVQSPPATRYCCRGRRSTRASWRVKIPQPPFPYLSGLLRCGSCTEQGLPAGGRYICAVKPSSAGQPGAPKTPTPPPPIPSRTRAVQALNRARPASDTTSLRRAPPLKGFAARGSPLPGRRRACLAPGTTSPAKHRRAAKRSSPRGPSCARGAHPPSKPRLLLGGLCTKKCQLRHDAFAARAGPRGPGSALSSPVS